MNKLQHFLPHKFPFLFIDRVVKVVQNRSIECEKTISCSEFFINKDQTIPRILLIEAMAQASGILVMSSITNSRESAGYLSSVSRAVFKDDIYAGDLITIGSEMALNMMPHFAFKTYVKKRDTVITEAELTLMII